MCRTCIGYRGVCNEPQHGQGDAVSQRSVCGQGSVLLSRAYSVCMCIHGCRAVHHTYLMSLVIERAQEGTVFFFFVIFKIIYTITNTWIVQCFYPFSLVVFFWCFTSHCRLTGTGGRSEVTCIDGVPFFPSHMHPDFCFDNLGVWFFCISTWGHAIRRTHSSFL